MTDYEVKLKKAALSNLLTSKEGLAGLARYILSFSGRA